MRRAWPLALAAVALQASACLGPPRAALTPQVRSALEESYRGEQARAWGARRFKALFRGEVSPKVGAIVRGYLSIFWDGTTLTWRTSAPLVGSARAGVITRGGEAAAEGLLPVRLSANEILGVLLGTPSSEALFTEARTEGDRFRVPMRANGGEIELDASGRVVRQLIGGKVDVRLEPGAGVPRKIDLRSPEGNARLELESFEPWPEPR